MAAAAAIAAAGGLGSTLIGGLIQGESNKDIAKINAKTAKEIQQSNQKFTKAQSQRNYDYSLGKIEKGFSEQLKYNKGTANFQSQQLRQAGLPSSLAYGNSIRANYHSGNLTLTTAQQNNYSPSKRLLGSVPNGTVIM